MKLTYDPNLVIPRPYPGDENGSFVLDSYKDVLEIVLLKSSVPLEMRGKILFGKKSAGPPGHVHGGCQAAVLDEMMGACGWHHGLGVVAGKIEVNFLQMVPYGKEIDLVARIIKQDDRKVTVTAEIILDGVVLAHSKGLFIVLSDERRKELAWILKK